MRCDGGCGWVHVTGRGGRESTRVESQLGHKPPSEPFLPHLLSLPLTLPLPLPLLPLSSFLRNIPHCLLIHHYKATSSSSFLQTGSKTSRMAQRQPAGFNTHHHRSLQHDESIDYTADTDYSDMGDYMRQPGEARPAGPSHSQSYSFSIPPSAEEHSRIRIESELGQQARYDANADVTASTDLYGDEDMSYVQEVARGVSNGSHAAYTGHRAALNLSVDVPDHVSTSQLQSDGIHPPAKSRHPAYIAPTTQAPHLEPAYTDTDTYDDSPSESDSDGFEGESTGNHAALAATPAHHAARAHAPAATKADRPALGTRTLNDFDFTKTTDLLEHLNAKKATGQEQRDDRASVVDDADVRKAKVSTPFKDPRVVITASVPEYQQQKLRLRSLCMQGRAQQPPYVPSAQVNRLRENRSERRSPAKSISRKAPLGRSSDAENDNGGENSDPTYTNTYPAGYFDSPRTAARVQGRMAVVDGPGAAPAVSSRAQQAGPMSPSAGNTPRLADLISRMDGAAEGNTSAQRSNVSARPRRARSPPSFDPSGPFSSPRAAEKYAGRAPPASENAQRQTLQAQLSGRAFTATGLHGIGPERSKSPDSPSPAPSLIRVVGDTSRSRSNSVVRDMPRSRSGSVAGATRPPFHGAAAVAGAAALARVPREPSAGSAFNDMARGLRRELEEERQLAHAQNGSRRPGTQHTKHVSRSDRDPDAIPAEREIEADLSNSGSGYAAGSLPSSSRTKVAANSSAEGMGSKRAPFGELLNTLHSQEADGVPTYPARLRPGAPGRAYKDAKAASYLGTRLPDVTGVTSALGSPCKTRDGVQHFPLAPEAAGRTRTRAAELAELLMYVQGLQGDLVDTHDRLRDLEDTQGQWAAQVLELRREMGEYREELRDVKDGKLARHLAHAQERGKEQMTQYPNAQDAENDSGDMTVTEEPTIRRSGRYAPREKDAGDHTSSTSAGGEAVASLRAHIARLMEDMAEQRALIDHLRNADREAVPPHSREGRRLRENKEEERTSARGEIDALRTQVARLAQEVEALRGVVETSLEERRQGGGRAEPTRGPKGRCEAPEEVDLGAVDLGALDAGRSRNAHARFDSPVEHEPLAASSRAGEWAHEQENSEQQQWQRYRDRSTGSKDHFRAMLNKSVQAVQSGESSIRAAQSSPIRPSVRRAPHAVRQGHLVPPLSVGGSSVNGSPRSSTPPPSVARRQRQRSEPGSVVPQPVEHEEEQGEESTVQLEAEADPDVSLVAQARAERTFRTVEGLRASRVSEVDVDDVLSDANADDLGDAPTTAQPGKDVMHAHDPKRCTVCTASRRSARRRESRRERVREAERERAAADAEEEAILAFAADASVGGAAQQQQGWGFGERQIGVLQKLIREHMDEFVHQRM